MWEGGCVCAHAHSPHQTCVCGHMHAYECVSVCICVCDVCVYVCGGYVSVTFVFMYVVLVCICVCGVCVYVCGVCVSVCGPSDLISVYKHMRTHKLLRMHTWLHAHTDTHTHTGTRTHTHTHTHTHTKPPCLPQTCMFSSPFCMCLRFASIIPSERQPFVTKFVSCSLLPRLFNLCHLYLCLISQFISSASSPCV